MNERTLPQRKRAAHAAAGARSLQFIGATGTVTGSKYLVELAGERILVDCGLFQGFKQLRLRNRASLPFAPGAVSAVILTHAHIDHSGYLPLFVKNGFAGKVYCTEATRDLCRILLPDAGRLQEEEADYANRSGFSKHRPALPLYTEADAKRALERLLPVDFVAPFAFGRARASLHPAGHILGAAMASIGDGERTLLFSGDLGRPHDAIMAPPAAIRGADVLVVESTYGGRRHDGGDPLERLGEVVRRTIGRGGAVIAPAFAVGRAQSLLWAIHRLKAEGAIPEELPVFLNSPMAADVTGLYQAHRGEHRLSAEECRAMCGAAVFVNSAEESRRLNERRGPMVIIAASGMATGGRVVHHLKAFAPDPRNTILFTGFQAGGTRGAAIVAGATAVKIHGGYVPVRAEVARIDNLSAHADGFEVIEWLKGFERPPRETFVTHGEPAAADAMRHAIEETLGWRCRVPEYLETVPIA